MKTKLTFATLLTSTFCAAQLEQARPEVAPVFVEPGNPAASTSPLVADPPLQPKSPSITDRVISEAPATVVVKPSNPFSGFRKVDKNGDGVLSMYELTTAFHRADVNGDERLSLEEFQQDIIDQPIDAGGTPDEPRIIIQRNEIRPTPAAPRAEPKRTKSTNGKAQQNSNTQRDSRNDGDGDTEGEADSDVDITTDGNARGNNAQNQTGQRQNSSGAKNSDEEDRNQQNRERDRGSNSDSNENSDNEPNQNSNSNSNSNSNRRSTRPGQGGTSGGSGGQSGGGSGGQSGGGSGGQSGGGGTTGP